MLDLLRYEMYDVCCDRKDYNMMDSFILDWVSWVQSTISVVFL